MPKIAKKLIKIKLLILNKDINNLKTTEIIKTFAYY